MDREKFFAHVREAPFSGHLTAEQVDGVDRILDEWERRDLTELWWLEYMLATVFHETAEAMQPVREHGGERYLQGKPYYPWVGEGLVQVTWEGNAKKFGAQKPGDLMQWPACLGPLFDGMISGMFTGRKLSQYFHHLPADGPTARRIVNGMDRANLIWGYAVQFHHAMVGAEA